MAGEIVDSVEMLRRLVAFDTTSRNSNLALIEYVQGYLKGHGIDSKLVPNEDGTKANLFATVGPNVKDGVVLSGHTDVVPVDGQPWVTDPWTLTLKDGKYYGRGTCDMKAFYRHRARHAAAVPEGQAQEADPLRASATTRRSAASAPIRWPPRMASEVPRPRAIIIGEPTMMTVVHAHKAAAGLRHHVHRLRGPFLDDPSRRQRHPFRRRVHPLPQRAAGRARGASAPKNSEFMPAAATFNVGTIIGGTAGNILARECEVLWGYRELPSDRSGEVQRRAKKWLPRRCCPR